MASEELILKLKSEAQNAINARALKKAVFSRPRDKAVIKNVLTAFDKNGALCFKSELFMRDGKNIQKVIAPDEAIALISEQAPSGYKQINLISDDKTLEVIISDKGKFRVTGSLVGAKSAEFSLSQDKKKSYIITPERDGEFLFALGITDKNGRIHDKKQAKYRQINKFLEQIQSISEHLPKDGTLTVCDLCCGKSYLTFAVYRYFTAHEGRDVQMYGVDLKSDVIDYCKEVACRLGYTGMHFECGDVSKFVPPSTPDLMISLHACDIATDFALAGAIQSGTKVILSTPCCQHEFNRDMDCAELSFITDYSILKQKLASAATDALRAKLLELHGYKVTVCELIDPEETPKNVLIRAVKVGGRRNVQEKLDQYNAACELLGITPTLAKLAPIEYKAKSLPPVAGEK